MAGNKIGIEVQVEFPTVAELKGKLQEKWRGVKDGFEAKINIDVDGNSLKSMKAKIKSALKEEPFHIKIDTSEAIKKLEKINKKIDTIDSELKKHRELKIDLKMMDFDKPFKEVLRDMDKVDKAFKDQKGDIDRNTNALKAQAGQWSKIQTTIKDINGARKATIKASYDDGNGMQRSITQNPDGTVDNTAINNRKQALKEIETIMKRLHSIENEMAGASQKKIALLSREKSIEQEQLALLKEQYSAQYKLNAMDDKGVQQLQRQQQLTMELKQQSLEAQRVKQHENEIASAVSKVAQWESQRLSLARKMVSAKGEEKDALKEQSAVYERLIANTRRDLDLENKMTAEQRQQLSIITETGNAQIRQAQAKQRMLAEEERLAAIERQTRAQQQAANSELMSQLKRIHALKLQIAKINTRKNNGGEFSRSDQERLEIAKAELKALLQSHNAIKQNYQAQNLITDEMREQMNYQQRIHANDVTRAQAVERVRASQDKINAELREHANITSQITQLQRDLIFAGMREESVIEGQIANLRQKQSILRANLSANNAITDSMRAQIAATERAQHEQLQLNRARQDGRERDRSYNDSGRGVVDPYTFFSQVERGARTVFEPIARVDAALVGVTKVADGTQQQFAKLASGSFDVASKLGVTSDEYLLAVEKWVTAGKSLKEAEPLAQKSLIGAFVGNIRPDDMVKYMSVPLKAFESAGLDANDIINTMNETANNHAIEMEDLGKAYSRSATTAKDAGVTYQELTGMITGAQEATRRGGERIGTSIKTVALNIGAIQSLFSKDNKKKYGYFSEELGIDMNKASGETKTMTQVLGELAAKWDTLTQKQKTNAKTMLGGKEHAETIGAIIDQWDKSVASSVKGAKEQTGLGEMGSAYAEHARQAESVQFKLAKLKNAWDKLMSTIAGGKNGATSVLDVLAAGLTKLTDLANNDGLMTALKYIFAGVAMHAGFNLWRRFFDMTRTGFGGMTSSARAAKSVMGDLVRMRNGTFGAGGHGGNGHGGNGNGGDDSTIIRGGGGHGGNGNGNNDRQPRRATLNRNGADGQPSAYIRPIRTVRRPTPPPPPAPDPHPPTPPSNANAGAGKAMLKTAGKALNLIPFIGDALLILDIMGVPVFDKIIAKTSKWMGLQEDATKNIKKQNDGIMRTNKLINGTVGANDTGVGQLQKGFDAVQQRDNNPKKKGTQWNFSRDEFKEYQESFNTMSQDMGFDIKITMNDAKHIEEQLNKLKGKVQEVKEASAVEAGDGLLKGLRNSEKNDEKLAKLKAKRDKEQAKLDDFKERKSKVDNGTADTKDYIVDWKDKIKESNKLLSEYDTKIKDVSQTQKEGAASTEEFARKFLSQNETLDASSIGKEKAIELGDRLNESLGRLGKEYHEAEHAQDLFSNGQKVTADNWREMMQLIPELADTGFSADDFVGKGSKENIEEVNRILEDAVKNRGLSFEKARQVMEQIDIASGKEVPTVLRHTEAMKKEAKAAIENAGAKKRMAENTKKTGAEAVIAQAGIKQYGTASKYASTQAGKNAINQKKEANSLQSTGKAAALAKIEKAGMAKASNTAGNAASKNSGKHKAEGKSIATAGNASIVAAGKHNKNAGAISGTGSAASDAKGKTDGLSNSIKKIPAKKSTSVGVKVGGDLGWFQKIISYFGGSSSKTVTLAMNTVKTVTHKVSGFLGFGKNKSVSSYIDSALDEATGSLGSTLISAQNAVSNASVSSATGDIASTPSPTNASVDMAKSSSTKKKTTSKSKSSKEKNNSKVSQEVWRYWAKEMNLDKTNEAMTKLETAIKNASEDYDKLIKLYDQQIKLTTTQINQNKSLYTAKDAEINSVLTSLKKYGFKVNTKDNSISNLSHSKSLKGESAEKAEELLNRWKSITSDMSSIKQNIDSLNQSKKDIEESKKQARIDKEMKSWEARIKKADAISKKVSNSDSISDTRLSMVADKDKELALVENEMAMNSSKKNLNDLMKEFNTLSTSTVSYKENADAVKSTLEGLSSSILSQADSVIKYKKALNNLEFSRVQNDLSTFNDMLSMNSKRMKNTVDNLKEGLLSGQSLSDLQSTKLGDLRLGRANVHEELAKERINLEKEVQQALDAFAKKNVDREKNVAKSTLDINMKMYNDLLRMKTNYSQGKTTKEIAQIKTSFGDLADIGKYDPKYEFVKDLDKAFDELAKKQNDLNSKYNGLIDGATDPNLKEDYRNQYIIESLKLQEDHFNAVINSKKNAIKEINKQLLDKTLDADQVEERKKAIDEYEEDIIEAQNSIKDSIKDRMEFELSLLDETIDKYNKYADKLKYAQTIIDAIGGNNFSAKGSIFTEMFGLEKEKNQKIRDNIKDLEQQLSLYEKESLQWQIINKQIEEYEKNLQDSNKTLIDMNQDILANSFDSSMDNLEKHLFDGKTLSKYKDYQDLWMDGLEKELKLEDMYQRIADLNTKSFDEKMAALDKEEKLSRAEMDYLEKQMDVLELEQKLENLNKQKTVQVLKQQMDGTWDWTYEAEQDEITKTQEELNDKKLELEKLKKEAEENYVNKLDKILDDAKNGNYDTVDGFKDAIDDLNKAYDGILTDMPTLQSKYLEELLQAYAKYIDGNKDIIDKIGADNIIDKDKIVGEIGSYPINDLDKVSKAISEAITKALVDIMPDVKASQSSTDDKHISIHIDKIDFPNATNSDEIQNAILSLPQVALQQSKAK